MYGGTLKPSDLEGSHGKPQEQIGAPQKAQVGELAPEAQCAGTGGDPRGQGRRNDVHARLAPRIFVVGPPGVGKSEFARLLAEQIRTQIGPVALGECGAILIKLLAEWSQLGPHKLVNGHNTLQDRIDNIVQWKPLYRAQLRWLGDLLAVTSPGFVARAACYSQRLSDSDVNADRLTRICVGVRRSIEVQPVLMPGDVWILVKRAGSLTVEDSFDAVFFEKFCKVKIENDGDVDALRAKARAFVATL